MDSDKDEINPDFHGYLGCPGLAEPMTNLDLVQPMNRNTKKIFGAMRLVHTTLHRIATSALFSSTFTYQMHVVREINNEGVSTCEKIAIERQQGKSRKINIDRLNNNVRKLKDSRKMHS